MDNECFACDGVLGTDVTTQGTSECFITSNAVRVYQMNADPFLYTNNRCLAVARQLQYSFQVSALSSSSPS
jgi:hypothetical protein